MDLCKKFSRPVNGGVVLKHSVVIWSAGRGKTSFEDSACDSEKTCCTPTAEEDKCSFRLLCAICMAGVKNVCVLFKKN